MLLLVIVILVAAHLTFLETVSGLDGENFNEQC